MANGNLSFTLWDVGHGLSIWIHTPNGSNHWIDLGRTPDFSPSQHVRRTYGITEVDCLLISHPDKDHLEDLSAFRSAFGYPGVLWRNKSLPPAEMFGQRKLQYQADYADLNGRFTQPVQFDRCPTNPAVNGGVRYAIHHLGHGPLVNRSSLLGGPVIEGNNTSLVVMLLCHGVLFVCPGDIEPLGWKELWGRHAPAYKKLINNACWRFLVAPHHGRKSGYCMDMMDAIRPHATFISDVWGSSETHPAFRQDPLGVTYPSGDVIRYYSTKRGGRVQVSVSAAELHINQWDG